MELNEVIYISLPVIKKKKVERNAQKQILPSLDQLLIIACQLLEQNILKVISPSRKRELVETRMIYYWLAWHYTRRTKTFIARKVNRDHASFYHGMKTLSDFLDTPEKKHYERYLYIISQILKGYEITRERYP